MSHLCKSLLVLACLPGLVVSTALEQAPKQTADSQPQRMDRFGEPLPAGAIQRLRTERMQGGHQLLGLAFSPDGKLLACGGQDKSVRIFEVASGRDLHQLEGHTGIIWAVAFSPDGQLVASSADDQRVRLWEVATGRELQQLPVHPGAAWFVTFSPDGKWIATACEDGVIRLWTRAGKEVRQLHGHQGGVWPLAFAPDGKVLASGGSDGTVRLWDLETGREVRQCAGHQGGVWPLAFSRDGRSVASSGWTDTALILWEVASGKPRRQFKRTGGGKCVALSPDGRYLASAGEDGAVTVRDLASGSELRRLPGHRLPVSAVTFSPDGRLLASAGQDNTVLLWDAAAIAAEFTTVPPAARNDDLEILWNDLADLDAARAYQAIWSLAVHAGPVVSFLEQRVRPENNRTDRNRVARLIADLDHNQFAIREQATVELEHLGSLAEPALRKARQGQLSLEAARRIERLLEKIDGRTLSPENLRALRAVEVLEAVGTAEAQRLLDKLAKGAPEALLTQEARETLQRLTRSRSAR